MQKISLANAVAEFQSGPQAQHYWEEHGISDEEAAEGLRVTFKALSIEFDDDCLFLWGQLSSPEEIEENRKREELRKAAEAAWRAQHPEEAARMDKLGLMITHGMIALEKKIVDDMFATNPIFQALRNKS